ncbi:cryptochrome/photolyase family protein [Namhaeicola litoreus]|uniref:Cryptochrome/photolyase family protein n=1 Tax=Namhaeicola litoreus TaxID=1052145 RepID=A0ABW3XYS8_9FLAO
MKEVFSVFWFRRDLRLEDNHGLFKALNSGKNVIPLFIFDSHILSELPKNDARVSFLYEKLLTLDQTLKNFGSSLLVKKGEPFDVWESLIKTFHIDEVFTNTDYEPYALKRDHQVKELLLEKGIQMHFFKDQVIFEKNEVLKADGKPYTVFTPYKNKWLSHFETSGIKSYNSSSLKNYAQINERFPTLDEIGFEPSKIKVPSFRQDQISNYAGQRDFPSISTTRIGPHLRFGTISIRQVILNLRSEDAVYFSELIWREFFMQILYHFPRVVTENFKPQYDGISWRNRRDEFEKWCNGETGYPMVDAGMRELNATGFMHNRARMVVASFLCKHLLIDWKWGEAYFAQKLLDYELASNNGNWQWAAGTGCDAAPYFRVFNPSEQVKKFDKDLTYIQKWVPELNTFKYPQPMVEHKMARIRAIETYKNGLERN